MVKRLVLTLLVVAATTPAALSQQTVPTVAMPEHWNPIQHAEIADCLATILERAQSGARSEQAAFIVLRDGGGFACVPWEKNRSTSHSAVYRGSVPNGTVAIAHTHPAGLPNPSRQDKREARRLDVPFIVVSLGMITMARPHDENVVTLYGSDEATATAIASSALSRSRPSDLSPR